MRTRILENNLPAGDDLDRPRGLLVPVSPASPTTTTAPSTSAAFMSHTLPRGRALSAGEIRALFVACAADRSPAGARDAAMLALPYDAGMRRQQVVRLDITDFDVETGAVTVRAGKGRKDRIAYTSNGSPRCRRGSRCAALSRDRCSCLSPKAAG